MTSSVSLPDPSLRPVQEHQSSTRPDQPITTVLRNTNPRIGPVSGGIEFGLLWMTSPRLSHYTPDSAPMLPRQ